MAPRGPKAAINGGHTAGIYADMTVDGPHIGTLVVIIDRAKNLPNRRTMGKQDPYCAARLGKEAKKTETDKRGGQTPKWDQEMRFMVHDSPDYYQLKVSVFNDDKKTELIGETWIALEDVIVPGGGKDDRWHHLNCKGRFAGEIRMELTYYDTRPRELKQGERQASQTTPGDATESPSGVGGPRQPKPFKRRPLPADPTRTTSDQIVPNEPERQQRPLPLQSLSNPYSANGAPDLNRNEPQSQQMTEHYPDAYYDQGHPDGVLLDEMPEQFIDTSYASLNQRHSASLDHHSELGHPYRNSKGDFQEQRPPQTSIPQYSQTADRLYEPRTLSPLRDHRHNSAPQPATTQPSILNSVHSSYHAPHNQSPHDQSETSPWQVNSLSQSSGFADPEEDDEQGPPPPPPTHRYSGNNSPVDQRSSRHAEAYPPIPSPAPLSIRSSRPNVSASPLSQVQASGGYQSYDIRTEQTSSRRPAHSISPSPSNFTGDQVDRRYERRSPSPMRDPYQMTPPSLKPGYDPMIAREESERISFENHMQTQRQPEAAPQFQAFATHDTQRRAHPSPRSQQVPDRLRFLNENHTNRAHRASAPLPYVRDRSPEAPGSASQTRHVSPDGKRMPQRENVRPDPRVPVRKSVSPQPAERRRSAIPFSPDSYDAPSTVRGSVSSTDVARSQYGVPDQVEDIAAQHPRVQNQSDGPIIGNDGRVIDPSDHLPTDTWAPEPETKTPRKAAEVTVRFRRGPQGAQPMPATSRRPQLDTTGRPHSISTSPSGLYSEDISPSSSARARLQKRNPNLLAHPASSPIVPTIHSASRGSPLRNQTSDYPARRDDPNSLHNTDPYSQQLPVDNPPPIPGKIPLPPGQDEWSNRSLSEEMSRIDIGVGGSTRPRRNRNGVY